MKGVLRKYSREAIQAQLLDFCYLANTHDVIELCEWNNGEGFDVTLSSKEDKIISLTYGEFKAIKKLLKELNKNEQKDTGTDF